MSTIYHFPKFITFQNNAAFCTLDKSGELKGYLLGKWERIQRFVVSEGLSAQKKEVKWRNTKPLKMFTVSSKVPMHIRSSIESLSAATLPKTGPTASVNPYSYENLAGFLNYNYVVSLRNPRSCDVTKDSDVSQEAELLVPTIRHIIEEYTATDHLQAFVFSILKSQDGRWYFLNCGRAKAAGSPAIKRKMTHRKTQSINELSTRLLEGDIKAPAASLYLPKITSMDVAGERRSTRQHSPSLRSCPHSPAHSNLISNYLDSVALRMDELRTQAHTLKQMNGSKQIIKFKARQHGFLERVISKVYDAVLKDPRLTRYFRHKDQIRSQVESAVKLVIVNGISKSNLRKVHEHLHITDFAFDRYVANFIGALRSEAARQEEITAAEGFFEGLREDVVTVKWEGMQELE